MSSNINNTTASTEDTNINIPPKNNEKLPDDNPNQETSPSMTSPLTKKEPFQPFMILLMGVPGSGKSRFAQDLDKARPNTFVRINPDVLGSKENAMARAKQAVIQERKCIIVDHYNHTAELRADWFHLAANIHQNKSEEQGEEELVNNVKDTASVDPQAISTSDPIGTADTGVDTRHGKPFPVHSLAFKRTSRKLNVNRCMRRLDHPPMTKEEAQNVVSTIQDAWEPLTDQERDTFCTTSKTLRKDGDWNNEMKRFLSFCGDEDNSVLSKKNSTGKPKDTKKGNNKKSKNAKMTTTTKNKSGKKNNAKKKRQGEDKKAAVVASVETKMRDLTISGKNAIPAGSTQIHPPSIPLNTTTTSQQPFLVILAGIPGSGKSTFARAMVQANPDKFVRVNQDELGKRKACETRVKQAIQEKKCVIVDRCNFDKKQRETWIKLAATGNPKYPVHCVVLNAASVEECIQRCQTRPQHETVSPREAPGIVRMMKRSWKSPDAAEIQQFQSFQIANTSQEIDSALQSLLAQA